MSCSFDITCPLRDFDLELKGEFPRGITGISGPSGAGKTTFFNLLAGLERPRSGTIRLDHRILCDSGRKIWVPVNRRRIGFVFQDNLLFPHMTVGENLLFGAGSKVKRGPGFDEVVSMLRLEKILKSRPSAISGGERQRTAIGRALLSSPEMLLLDEPFHAVDYGLRSAILPLLKGLEERLAVPIVIISHDREDLEYLTDRIFHMDRGRQTCPYRHLSLAGSGGTG